jgi:hypothetical protein
MHMNRDLERLKQPGQRWDNLSVKGSRSKSRWLANNMYRINLDGMRFEKLRQTPVFLGPLKAELVYHEENDNAFVP